MIVQCSTSLGSRGDLETKMGWLWSSMWGPGFAVLVDDYSIKVVKVKFNKQNSLVIVAIMATQKIRNSNFYPVGMTSLSSQAQYMNMVVGTYMTTNASFIQPWSEQLKIATIFTKSLDVPSSIGWNVD
ncbi:hypothetical protein HPG69_016161 [Diceros bicornis minor]|uniref:Transmembrane protein 106 C-terminal domain-containing protein n=1 Tax=Diceros bicornis minor TaxID=77932 RepID=A0A7J7FHF8_DICBM|nr:hypothetical protein HPG69_016161 [Diceros bicornis minor]